MIYLNTGLPGHGKTLYTIAYVKQLAEKDHRPVFYSGIKDLALDWTEIEAEKWMDCPDGSIVVIDECQTIFRPRGRAAQVPEYVSALETHRHKGIDIFLITQHPMLIDSNVRRLTERHSHISRRFGMQRSTIFQFESCKDRPLDNTTTAQRLEWKFPVEAFNYYKSAEVHTVKRRLPMQYALMFIVPLIVGALIWFFINRHYQDGKFVSPNLPAASSSDLQVHKSTSAPGATPDKIKPMTTAEYINAYQPRIEGLAYTAPIYDKVTEPTEAPIPAACIESTKQGCKCYSQQGTKLDMPQMLCSQIVKNGFFQSFGKKPDAEQPKSKQIQPQLAERPQDHIQRLPETAPISLASLPTGNTSTNPRFNPSQRENP